jgi:hypothetical protein
MRTSGIKTSKYSLKKSANILKIDAGFGIILMIIL